MTIHERVLLRHIKPLQKINGTLLLISVMVLMLMITPLSTFAQNMFIRGDATGDGIVDAADQSLIIGHIFSGAHIDCLDAADVNDDGNINSSDVSYIVNYLSSGGPPPLAPFPNCGLDPTPGDFLDCAIYDQGFCSCCIGSRGNVDNDILDNCDITDLTYLIDILYINFPDPECPEEANVNGDTEGSIDITDLTELIDILFINFPDPAPCP